MVGSETHEVIRVDPMVRVDIFLRVGVPSQLVGFQTGSFTTVAKLDNTLSMLGASSAFDESRDLLFLQFARNSSTVGGHSMAALCGWCCNTCARPRLTYSQ